MSGHFKSTLKFKKNHSNQKLWQHVRCYVLVCVHEMCKTTIRFARLVVMRLFNYAPLFIANCQRMLRLLTVYCGKLLILLLAFGFRWFQELNNNFPV